MRQLVATLYMGFVPVATSFNFPRSMIQSTVGATRLRETFIVVYETGNERDRHAMAVYRDEPGIIVGHLPREIAKTCYYFTRHEGKISGEVAGRRIHSEEAGGLEVPCLLKIHW